MELKTSGNQNLCCPRQAWVTLRLPWVLLRTTLQLCRLPPPLPPPVRNSGCPFTQGQPLYASCCTVLLYFSRYCAIRLKMIFYFLCLFFMYYLCEKYNPITVQYCIADCVSGVLRLTIGLTNMLLEWNLFVNRGLAVICTRFVDNLYQAEEILF